mmetsp:Transcript_18944/g.39434  ORF Transcript_18944/g.39434 Transcript_18944/m.39434 type:complete len:222 (-) Transcript_18944:750-1415(-)
MLLGWLYMSLTAGPLVGLLTSPKTPCLMRLLRQVSTARSQDCHRGWLLVSGSFGMLDGVQLRLLMMRSARRKFRNRLATRRSCLKSRWNSGDGSMFHAIVSVIAVNIQFSSPIGVFLSFILPGILSTQSGWIPAMESLFWLTNQRRAIGIGVVRQLVKTSCGNSGFRGRFSSFPHGQSTMHFFVSPTGSSSSPPWKKGRSTPAAEQSSTTMLGCCIHPRIS